MDGKITCRKVASRDIRRERATLRWTMRTSRVAFIVMITIGKNPWNMPNATLE